MPVRPSWIIANTPAVYIYFVNSRASWARRKCVNRRNSTIEWAHTQLTHEKPIIYSPIHIFCCICHFLRLPCRKRRLPFSAEITRRQRFKNHLAHSYCWNRINKGRVTFAASAVKNEFFYSLRRPLSPSKSRRIFIYMYTRMYVSINQPASSIVSHNCSAVG